MGIGIGRPQGTTSPGSLPGDVVTKTSADMTFYVRSGGDDGNDGLTEGNALATIQEAVDRVPKFIEHAVVIDIGEGDFDGAYLAGFQRSGTSPSFTIQGVLGNPTLTTGATSGTATAGTTRSVTDSGQSWTPNELIGYLALVDGEYRVIYDNDATSFDVVSAYNASTNGKAYEILEQKTNINTAEPVTGWGGITTRNCNIQPQIEDIKMTGMDIGLYNGYTKSSAEPQRCRFQNCTYAGYFCQSALDECQILHTAAIDCDIGFFVANVSVIREMLGSLAYDNDFYGILGYCAQYIDLADAAAIANGSDGINIAGVPLVSATDPIYNNNGATGITIGHCNKLDFNGDVTINNNTTDGIYLNNVSFADLDGGIISTNGGYGIRLDENSSSNRVAGSMLNLACTLTIANNTSGGIIGKNHSIIALTNVDGSNTGYGLELQTGSYATITSATGLTGTTADATIDGGNTDLDWATDFVADGDIVNNMANGCRIERAD